MDTSMVDQLELYLRNNFKPGQGQPSRTADGGRKVFNRIVCSSCHVADLTINHDRRVADLETNYDPARACGPPLDACFFNALFASASAFVREVDDGSGLPHLKLPQENSFLVKDIFTDFKRHDVGPNFYERNWDGSTQIQFLTRPLWGVGSTGPYGHDGRSITLNDVILRHGGEGIEARKMYPGMGLGEA